MNDNDNLLNSVNFEDGYPITQLGYDENRLIFNKYLLHY